MDKKIFRIDASACFANADCFRKVLMSAHNMGKTGKSSKQSAPSPDKFALLEEHPNERMFISQPLFFPVASKFPSLLKAQFLSSYYFHR